MTKYYKRGQREYYQVTPERVIRIVNKYSCSYITIAHENKLGDYSLAGVTKDFLNEEALEGVEIQRSEFENEFEVASRLIVLEP